jgi:hypothetical protein
MATGPHLHPGAIDDQSSHERPVRAVDRWATLLALVAIGVVVGFLILVVKL